MYKNVSNLIDGTYMVLNAQLLVEILKEKKEIDVLAPNHATALKIDRYIHLHL